MAYWTEHSLGFARQSAFGAANSTDADFTYLKCETPTFAPATEITELDLLTGQIGAGAERLVGRRSGTLSFTVPLEGFKAGYNPASTSNNPGDAGIIPPWFCLLANAMGSNNSAVASAADFAAGAMCSNSAYGSADVTSATSEAITLDTGEGANQKCGAFMATSTSATSTDVQMGFIKTKAGDVCTLFEASGKTVNSTSANVYGTATAYASDEAVDQIPLTFRWKGQDATFCYILQDCICESINVTWEAGAVPTAEFSFRVYDYTMDKTKGTLEIPDSFSRVPQLVGSNNGRATINGSVACTLASCTWNWSVTVTDVVCHSATQGITGVVLSKPRIRASFSVLHTSADLVYNAAGEAGNTGSHKWQSWLERGVPLSIATYVGSKIGRIWAQLIPAATITEVPAIENRDGAVAYTINVEAGSYSGDETDTLENATNSPINSIARQALA